jgi:hypothetical protein
LGIGEESMPNNGTIRNDSIFAYDDSVLDDELRARVGGRRKWFSDERLMWATEV